MHLYICKLNQDITKAHSSNNKYKLFSEFRPMFDIYASRFRCVLYLYNGKNTCAMTKTLAPEFKWIYLRNISVEKHTSPRRTNGWAVQDDARTSGGNKYAKVCYKMIFFNCQNVFMKKMNVRRKKTMYL